jgi:c-di-GMP-related signal transduction protein
MIDEKKLYPLSCLKGLRDKPRNRLINSGIVLIKQLLEEDPSKLARKAKLREEMVRAIAARAKSGLDELEHS